MSIKWPSKWKNYYISHPRSSWIPTNQLGCKPVLQILFHGTQAHKISDISSSLQMKSNKKELFVIMCHCSLSLFSSGFRKEESSDVLANWSGVPSVVPDQSRKKHIHHFLFSPKGGCSVDKAKRENSIIRYKLASLTVFNDGSFKDSYFTLTV